MFILKACLYSFPFLLKTLHNILEKTKGKDAMAKEGRREWVEKLFSVNHIFLHEFTVTAVLYGDRLQRKLIIIWLTIIYIVVWTEASFFCVVDGGWEMYKCSRNGGTWMCANLNEFQICVERGKAGWKPGRWMPD